VRTLLIAALAGWGGAAAASGGGPPGVVVLVFDGAAGARASAAVSGALRGVRVVSAAAYRRTATRLGAGQAGRMLAVDAIVRGAIAILPSGPRLLVELVSATSERRLARLSLPLQSAAVDQETAARVASRLAAALRQPGVRGGGAGGGASATRRRRGAGGARAPAATDTTSDAAGADAGSGAGGDANDDPGSFDDGGDFERSEGDIAIFDPVTRSTSPARGAPGPAGERSSSDRAALGYAVGTARSSPHDLTRAAPEGGGSARDRAPDTAPAEETIYPRLELGAGVLLLARGFRFLQPVNPPRPPTLGTPSLLPALHLSAALQPLAFWTQRPIAGLGLTLRFWRALAGTATLPETPDQPFALVLQTVELGLRYYWSLLGRRDSPALLLRTAYGYQLATTEPPPGVVDPTVDVAYSYLRAGAGLRWPFAVVGRFELGATVGLDYLGVLTAGPIEQANSEGYGRAAILAFDGSLGIFVAYAGVFARLEGSYRRFELAFDRSCTPRQTGCRQAVGARDIYAGATLELGYAF